MSWVDQALPRYSYYLMSLLIMQPVIDQNKESAHAVRLLILEDFNFTVNGGIENVISSLLPELAISCEMLVWVLPEYKISSAISRLLRKQSIQLESLDLSFWQPGWCTKIVLSLVSRIDRGNRWLPLRSRLSARAKRRRLQSVIRKYGLTHLLNLGVFDQPFPDVTIPVFGIVYDTNYSPELSDACIRNLWIWARKAKGIITISAWARKQICLKIPFASAKIHDVPIAVNPPPLMPGSRQHSNSNEITTFLYPASFSFHKNHQALLEAFSTLHSQGYSFKMVFCGYNTNLLLSSEPLPEQRLEAARSFLAATSPEFKACICPLGIVEQNYLERLFQEADYVVLPSMEEGFGLPLTEALARGVPVLCSDIPPFREQIETYDLDESVIIVGGADADSWSAAIRNLLNQPPLMSVSLPAIHDKLSKWTWKNVAYCYKRLMHELPY